ncbi:Lrp/AsnC family transcriptional regulator [Nocardioides sp. BP30]|uniref:Lrp/AsnC family transcriptional regulator n=1 Tax=Nocardioides sp. BP30 TaxID=3036374 RepID=UPI002469A76C|nr:Lrp/AsnC family transcriptional regulator [Nocardioides sp. BP30]WGL50742.1 Lrp/AsnC family transcriptional regulator [Nocardioides sp. BP30]
MAISQGVGERSWDVDDLRVIRALQLAPRASFARIGAVLGMNERTVARRYRALHREGVLRVFGTVNPVALGQQIWQVRVRCRPDAAESLAAGLSARDDVVWVGLTAAGSEVTFSLSTVTTERRDLLLTRTLPRAAHVLDIDAAVVLHIFLGMSPDDWSALGRHLNEEETAELATPLVNPARTAERFELEEYDAAILRLLARDGRASNAALAQAAGISEGRAARRVATLIERGVVIIDNDLATEAFGYGVRAHLLLRVAPSHIEAVGRTLAELPEISFVASTSGRNNVMASMTCRELSDLYEFTTAQVGALDGIQNLEVLPFQRIVKQSGGLLVDGRLVDPA